MIVQPPRRARGVEPPVARRARASSSRVVDHLVAAAEVRVLVGERVEAVRAAGDDLRDAGLVERLDVLLGERLEDVLVADPPRRVAGAALARAEDREVDARLVSAAARSPRAVVRARSSNEEAQPTQYRYSGAGSPGSSTRTPSSAAQSARSDCALPHGFEARSTSRSIGSASAGKLDSTITRWRRRSTMWSTCSIETGQACTQAPQVTQSQTTVLRARRSGTSWASRVLASANTAVAQPHDHAASARGSCRSRTPGRRPGSGRTRCTRTCRAPASR